MIRGIVREARDFWDTLYANMPCITYAHARTTRLYLAMIAGTFDGNV